MDAQPSSALGFVHFVANTDAVAKALLLALALLSVLSWYHIVARWLTDHLAERRAALFLKRFWAMGNVARMTREVPHLPDDNAFASLAMSGIDALEHRGHEQEDLARAGGVTEYLTRVLNNRIDQEAIRSEQGLTLLASAGSAAPYLGLLGTVWGIYHALLEIGLSGQGTLDKVAGPVGEALVMTALGLVVAIPAVLAHSAFTRRNRLWLARLEGFAHDLYVLLTVKASQSGAAEPCAPQKLQRS